MYTHILIETAKRLVIILTGKVMSFAFFSLLLLATVNITAQNTLDPSFNAGVTDAPASNYVSAVQPDGKILVGGSYQFANGVPRGFFTRLNTDGALDSTFNAGGSGANGDVLEIVVLSNGKILIGGSFSTYNGMSASKIARLNSDGTLDTTFNSGGTGVSGATGRLTSIVIQTDGKILIGGQSTTGYNGVTSNGISRLNADGSFDSSFTSGFATLPSIEQVILQADGKILIGGFFSTYGGTSVSGVIRVNFNGTLDTTFNAGGAGTGGETGNAIAGLGIQPDGKILIGGDFDSYNGVARSTIARLNTNGTLDTTFVPPTFSQTGFIESFAVQTDGKVLVAGLIDVSNTSVRPVIRLNTDGSLDSSFNLRADNLGYHVTLQTDGKIIVTGFFIRFTSGESRQGIVRINSNGTIDSAFSPTFARYGLASAITQQTDGKILVGGSFQRANGNNAVNVARFNTDGTTDIGFSIGSGSTLDSSFRINTVSALATQTDGKILVGGTFGSFNNSTQGTLVRLNANGSLDSTFTVTGDINISFSLSSVESILVQPDEKILIGGRLYTLAGSLRGLVRLNSDGSLDTAFNGGATTASSVVYKILRQSSGKLLIFGAFTNYSGTARARIARLNADGSLDTTFNPGTGANGIVYDAAEQLDGKILISGAFTTINGTARNRIARLNADGSLDTSFDPGAGADNIVYSLTILPSGTILAGGLFANFNSVANSRLVRLNANGSLDNSFVSGMENTSFFQVRRIVTQFDGKPLIGGTFSSYAGIPRNNLARLFTTETVGGNQPILFLSNRDGNQEIYRMNADGSNQQRLTNSTENEIFTVWSPDGSKILFTRQISTNVRQIWTMNADGSNQTRISPETVFSTIYKYSPNGQKILFARSPAVGTDNLWVMDANGSNAVQLTSNTSMIDHFAEWSPDGAKIAFGRCTPQFVCDIYTMNADGTNQTNLTTDNPANDDDNPKWTKDGSRIVYGRISNDRAEPYVMNANGTNKQPLGGFGANQYSYPQAISPDGNTIALDFSDGVTLTSREIYKVGINGGVPVNLTNNNVLDLFGAWSPDSQKIAFRSRRDAATDEIYTMNADGSAVVRLTFNTAADSVADWYKPAPPRRAAFDFDGDGKADVSVFRPSNGAWYLNQSTSGFVGLQFGATGDRIVPADYDGDGKTDVAVFRAGVWYLNRSQLGFTGIQFGAADDIPMPADYDGDGKADLAVFRPASGAWYLQQSTAGFTGVNFGQMGDVPVAADYDGDGKADVAVFRGGTWYLNRSQLGFTGVAFGNANDKPSPADYDGDGKADVAVFRPADGTWYLQRSQTGFTGIQFGQSGDVPAAADYDGDGKVDVVVFRNGTWYLNRTQTGFTSVSFGTTGDKAVPNAFIP